MGGFETVGDDSAGRDRAELESRLADVQEQFRATSDILKVLTSATHTGQPGRDLVFDAVVDNARRLLDAQVAQIYLVDGDSFVLARSSGLTPEFVDFVAEHPIARDRATLVGASRWTGSSTASTTSWPTPSTGAPTSRGSAGTGP